VGRCSYDQSLWHRVLRQFGYVRRPPRTVSRLQISPARPGLSSAARAQEGPCSAASSSVCGSLRRRILSRLHHRRERAEEFGPRGMVRDLLFEKSPYDKFDPRPYPGDLQGWGSDHPVLVESIQILRPARICEVGSWKGRSAINMARAVKALRLTTEIVCVDTWLGSPEHWLRQDPEWYASLQIRNGMPQLYYTFLANVVRAKVTDVITPFPTTSDNAAAVFSALGTRFDLIYIDAAHEYEPAKRDISTYYDLLADDGLLIGDDYLVWPGVTEAANAFAHERNLRLIGVQGKFLIPKGAMYADIAFTK
jgi:predicted O-methyltransferase YrrM